MHAMSVVTPSRSFGLVVLCLCSGAAADSLTIDTSQVAGISGFRAHWDQTIALAEDGARIQVDGKVKDRGQTAMWGGVKPAALSFDAVHRQLLVRFPGAAERIAEELAAGKAVAKAELVLPYADEEIWPPGRVDFSSPDGYRFRQNWDCDNFYRGVVRPNTAAQLAYHEQRPNWHAVAWALRKPWQADAATGPTYNAAVKGAVYWRRFGASDTAEDRFPVRFGPAEVSTHQPDGRVDVTAALADPAYGATPGQRLRRLADCGFIVAKEEVYDWRYYVGAYEFTTTTGGRAIVIKQPRLVITWKPEPAAKTELPPAADISATVAQHAGNPIGAPSAVIPTPEAVAQLNERFLAKPAWMPAWQYARVRQLMGLGSGGRVEPFYYRLLPEYVARDVQGKLKQTTQGGAPTQEALDYAVYLAWLDWSQGRQPRTYEGHLTAADAVTQWFGFREALPEAVRDTVVRGWNAWLMPDRESAMTDAERKDYGDVSGKLIHPMADDPRVGMSAGKAAAWNQGDTYYLKTGDWRGNKSFFRSGFTSMMSTANFNSTAVTGALLCGQMIGSERAIADGSAGLLRFPFWLWTWNAGVGQEYIDHYYWSIATAGNKLFADHAQRPQDRMAGWSIMQKMVNDLAMGYHPGLRKLVGPASRTFYEHVLGQQDGIYHILHVLSPKGVLCDAESGTLPDLTSKAKDPNAKPISAWGHDYPPEQVAQNSLSGPWADPWMSEWIDEKPLPWYALAEKKVVAEGDLVATWFGRNYALASIRATGQRIQVQGKWRRKAEAPSSMRELGSLDVLVGFNQTQFGCDGEGIVSKQGIYRIAQHHGKAIVLARPDPTVIARQAGEHPFGQGKAPAQDITSVQCTVALFNYEAPQPTWSIRIDGTPIAGLPATAKTGQVITIQDGVSYLAIRPLPTTDLGRDSDVTLEVGQPQTQAYHEHTNIQSALQIHANFYRRAAPLAKGELERLKGAYAGFAIEMGDEAEYGRFARFEEHVRAAQVQAGSKDGAYAATYTSGADSIAVNWPAALPPPPPPAEGAAPVQPPADPPFTVAVNGADPYAAFKAARLWQDTPLGQISLGRRLDKAGALVERSAVTGNDPMLLQVFPQQKTSVCTNPVPGWKAYRFRTPEGIAMEADGLLSMGQWAVVDGGRRVQVRHVAFDVDAPNPEERASVLFVSGLKDKPQTTLNGETVEARACIIGGVAGWLIALAKTPPGDDSIATRLAAAKALIEAKEAAKP